MTRTESFDELAAAALLGSMQMLVARARRVETVVAHILRRAGICRYSRRKKRDILMSFIDLGKWQPRSATLENSKTGSRISVRPVAIGELYDIIRKVYNCSKMGNLFLQGLCSQSWAVKWDVNPRAMLECWLGRVMLLG